VTQKGTSLPGTTSFDVFFVKIRSSVYAVALLKNSKNEETSHPKGTVKSRIWGAETPELIATIFCHPGHHHACQFL